MGVRIDHRLITLEALPPLLFSVSILSFPGSPETGDLLPELLLLLIGGKELDDSCLQIVPALEVLTLQFIDVKADEIGQSRTRDRFDETNWTPKSSFLDHFSNKSIDVMVYLHSRSDRGMSFDCCLQEFQQA